MDTSKRIPLLRENEFPNLFSEGYGKTSEDDVYNCIAWAAGEKYSNECWTPFEIGNGYYWPDGLERNAEVETFVKLYRLRCGYEPCPANSAELEPGVEKVALFADSKSEIQHAARQNADGTWTSKLGDWEDIDHRTLKAVAGSSYGEVVKILQRPRPVPATMPQAC